MKASPLRQWNPILLVTGILIGLIIVSIWVWPQLSVSQYSSDSLKTLYILSAIAQSLAVIAGLVVGALLMVSQTSSRQVLNAGAKAASRLTVEFVLLFAGTLAVSLCLIARLNLLTVKLPLTFAGAALVMLVPFLLTVKDRLNVEKQIRQMKETAKSQVKEFEDEPEEVRAIDAAAIHAYFVKDYEVFEQGQNALSEIAVVAYENLKINTGHSILDHVLDNTDLSINDSRASMKAINILEDIALKFTERGAELVPNRIIRGVKKIGLNAASRQQESAVVTVIGVLEKIGTRMAEKGMYDAEAEVLSAIEAISMRCLTKDLSEPGEITIDILTRLAAIAPPSAVERNGRKAGKNTHADITTQLAKTMDSIVAKAVECRNEPVVTKAVVTLKAISQAAAEGSVPANVGEIAINGLRSVGLLWKEDGTETICQSLGVLGEAALSFTDNNRPKLMWNAIEAIGRIGLKHSSPEVMDKLAFVLGEIGMRAAQKGVFEGVAATEILTKIGVRALKADDAVGLERVTAALGAIAEKAVMDKSQYFARKANEALLALQTPGLQVAAS